MTLWNPTIHPVTIHPRVPVTREYTIRDPAGNLIPAEVLQQGHMANIVAICFRFYSVPSDSRDDEKCSRSSERCPESVPISSIVARTGLQYLLFRSYGD